jgi:transcriptional regulator with XRE-family HTH domain
MANKRATELADALRHRVRTLREERGWARRDIAVLAQHLGFEWDQDTVAGIERGIREIKLAEVFLFLQIFGLSLDELIPASDAEPIALTKDWWVNSLETHTAGNHKVQVPDAPAAEALKVKDPSVQLPGTDQVALRRAAKRVGFTPKELDRRAKIRWGQPFVAERDERVADRTKGATPSARSLQALRGLVTRALLEELNTKAPRQGRKK